MDERQGAAAFDACAGALDALTSGALDRWHGLPAGCDRERLAKALTLDTPPAAGHPGFSGYASYLPTAGAPDGVRAYIESDRVMYLQVGRPQPTRPLQELLGDPEATLPSQWDVSPRQLVYASRGLSIHVNPGGVPRVLFAFPATTVDAFTRSELARLSMQRSRR